MTCKLRFVFVSLSLLALTAPAAVAESGPVVPGTGKLIDFVGDQFEQGDWNFIHNHPKSSRENDERTRFPNGRSTNGRWFEGPERGQPDLMKVVPTPAGGIEGSQQALLVRTRHSGVPGRRSFDVQQDDLIVDGVSRVGAIPVSEVPSITTRVYLPPAEEWENRSGPHFGFRGTTVTTVWKTDDEEEQRGRFRMRIVNRRPYRAKEQYWPGIWVHFRSETSKQFDEDSAFLTVRGDRLGRDFKVMDISKEDFGWWTMGMSFTGDGRVHFYARKGVEDLTAADHLTSQAPYSYRAERMENMFFDFCNYNDGKTWSTPFVIDDPKLYVLHGERVSRIAENKKRMMAERTARMEAQKKHQRSNQRQR